MSIIIYMFVLRSHVQDRLKKNFFPAKVYA